MGFSYGVAIVTATDVASITHESGLTNLDDASSGATLANLLPEATNEIWRALKKWRGIDPAKVNNTQEFKKAAAYWVVAQVYGSKEQGDEENARKFQRYRAEFEQEIKTIEVDTSDPLNSTLANKGLPVFINLDREGYVNRPVDNRRPIPMPTPPFRIGP